MRSTPKIELYDEGEYCEDVPEGKTCIDRYSNAPCNSCLRWIENIEREAEAYPLDDLPPGSR